MIPSSAFLLLAVVLFVLGIVAFFVKKDLLTQFRIEWPNGDE